MWKLNQTIWITVAVELGTDIVEVTSITDLFYFTMCY